MNASSLTLSDWLPVATRKLEHVGIGTARLDCLVLLEDVTGKDRGWLLAHPEYTIKSLSLARLDRLIKRRSSHEPLAYIRGKTEFYGREFIVGKDVLEPRPESEAMIDLLRVIINNQQSAKNRKQITVVDLGTGSGAIGITAGLEFPGVNVILTDIDPACLKTAKVNAKKHGARVEFLKGNLLEPVFTVSCFMLIALANLPYVPDHYQINEAALMEPRIAIFGGSDGLDLYRRMFDQVSKMQHKPEYIFTESLPFQHNELVKIASSSGFKVVKSEDFIQCFQS